MIRNIFICIVFVLFGTKLCAQKFCAISIGYEKGLPSLEVFDLYQDKQGYIWLGHNNGLSRYDGNSFRSFVNPNLSGKSLSLLKQDASGRIWCINFTGQIAYVEHDSLHILEAYNNLHEPNFALFDIDTLSNVLYASSSKGIFRYEINTGKWKVLKPEGIKKPDTQQILVVGKDELIFTTGSSGCWKYQAGKFFQLNTPGDEYEFSSNTYPVPSYKYLFFDRFKKIFFDASHGIRVLKTNFLAGELSTFSVIDGVVYMNTTAGSYHLSVKGDSVLCSLFSADGNISDIIKDREGSYWLSTLSEGIKLIPNLDFKLYVCSGSNSNANKISSVYPYDELHVLAGTPDGRLIKYDLNGKQIKEWQLPEAKALISIKKDPINNGYYLSAGYTYYLGNDEKIRKLSTEPLNIKDFQFDNEVLMSSSPIGLTLYGEAASSPFLDGLVSSNKHQENLLSIFLGNKRFKGITLGEIARCRSVCVDTNSGVLWACYANGLLQCTTKGAEFVKMDNNRIYANQVISDGSTTYIATVEKGVLLYENNQLKKSFDRKQGLPDDYVIELKLNNERLWVLTPNGIVSCKKDFSDAKMYTKEDGFIAKDPSNFIISAGKVWVSCGQGLISFPIDAPSLNTHLPSVYIQSLSVNDKPVEFSNDLEFHPTENNIQIGLLGFAYRSGTKFHYLYCLRKEGSDQVWYTASAAESSLKFYSLGSGKYQFEAYAVNEDGVRSAKPIAFSFTILKPFYLRPWFLLLILVLILGGLLLVMMLRVNMVRKKARTEMEKALLEKNLIEARLSAIRAQMNPHFLFNALSSVQSMFLKNDQKRANENLARFSKLMRTILDMSNRQEVSLEEEIAMLKLYIEIEINRFDMAIEYKLEIDPTLMLDEIIIPSLVLQPFVENVFKHAFAGRPGAKQLVLRFKLVDDTLVAEIEDNGWGMEYTAKLKEIRKSEFKSFSTSATSKRIELINKTRDKPIRYYTEEAVKGQSSLGTRIVFVFPIDKTDE